MDDIDIMKSFFKAEDKEYSSKLIALDKDIRELEATRARLARSCTHPINYVRIHNDGYRGSACSADVYRAECTLCDKRMVGFVRLTGSEDQPKVVGEPEALVTLFEDALSEREEE